MFVYVNYICTNLQMSKCVYANICNSVFIDIYKHASDVATAVIFETVAERMVEPHNLFLKKCLAMLFFASVAL